MHVDIQSRGFVLTESLLAHTKRRLDFATDWTHDDVRRVRVRLSDINGPRGGEDKRCLIEIPVAGRKALVISNVDADLYTAIDRAASRAERVLAQRLTRMREHRHTKLPAMMVTKDNRDSHAISDEQPATM